LTPARANFFANSGPIGRFPSSTQHTVGCEHPIRFAAAFCESPLPTRHLFNCRAILVMSDTVSDWD
jgi:hypothetical protein